MALINWVAGHQMGGEEEEEEEGLIEVVWWVSGWRLELIADCSCADWIEESRVKHTHTHTHTKKKDQ